MALAEQLAEALAKEFQIDGKAVRTGVTTGISVFPHNGSDAASLLANAGAALFRAKQKSRGTISVFEPEMDQQIRDRRVLHQDLSVAIKNGELSLYYQPQADVGPDGRHQRGHRLRGAGALAASAARLRLARRFHSARGRKRPDRRNGRMDPARGLPRGGLMAGAAADRGQPVAGAVHARRRRQPRAFDPAGNRACARPAGARNHRGRADRGFRPRPGAAAAAEGARRAHLDGRFRQRLFLAELSAGVPVRQDQDRPRLRHQSRHATRNRPAIVRAVIDLGHGLEMSIVAEGVETQEQLAFLSQEGCDAVQGYLHRQARADRPIRQPGRPHAGNTMEPARKTG